MAALPVMTKIERQLRDLDIMNTNNSSIVSKRSVEKLYYPQEPEFFRHFVSKFKRRAPLINRGYWLRMRAIEHAVEEFLREPSSKRKLIINLGCGYDPLPWLFFGRSSRKDLCKDAKFIDVDYSDLMHRKVDTIKKTPRLSDIFADLTYTAADDGVLCDSEHYAAVGANLRDLDFLQSVLKDRMEVETASVAILFVAEVSIAYMDMLGSQAVIAWAASYEDARFCLLEQHLPDGKDHPFAQTMLKHFEKLRTPLTAVGTMAEMKQRFITAGWPADGVDIRSLWRLWQDPTFLSDVERRSLDEIEPFDEWEEFALFASHYFLLVARIDTAAQRSPTTIRNHDRLSASKLPRKTSLKALFSQPRLQAARSERHTSSLQPASSGHFGTQEAENTSEGDSPPSNSDKPDFPAAMTCEGLDHPYSQRRFAAIIPRDYHQENDATEQEPVVGLYGGIGPRERLGDVANYVSHDAEKFVVRGPPTPQGLVCHTSTQLGSAMDCLVVGGRTTPSRASSACWYRQSNSWNRVADLPEGRYRHCAIALQDRRGSHVLIFGGKSSWGRVLNTFQLWHRKKGWQEISPNRHIEGRFGALLVHDSSSQSASHSYCNGYLVGGMNDCGIICEQLFRWSLNLDNNYIELTELAPLRSASRFGAQAVDYAGHDCSNSFSRTLIIGGIGLDGVIARDEEIYNFDDEISMPMQGARPLLIGNSFHDHASFGGGATCFSFGTFWNPTYLFHIGDNERMHFWRREWRLSTKSETQALLTRHVSSAAHEAESQFKPRNVDIIDCSSPGHIAFADLLQAGKPVILRGCNIGPCTTKWTAEYLKSTMGDRKVVVHSSSSTQMDFQKKNFKYEVRSFGNFIDAVVNGELLYMRALSTLDASEQVTELAKDYPDIADDFQLPAEFAAVTNNAHSSPLRISGPVNMWLHYDVMANVLCQIQGRKRLLLYPPSDVKHLGLEAGMSSSSINVFEEHAETHPMLKHCHPHEAQLDPGDILLIPALWLHAAAPNDGMSVAVNVFFRDLQSGYAAGRDVYGNRDLAAYERGRKDVAKLAKSFADLPPERSQFYLDRLIMELRSLAGLT